MNPTKVQLKQLVKGIVKQILKEATDSELSAKLASMDDRADQEKAKKAAADYLKKMKSAKPAQPSTGNPPLPMKEDDVTGQPHLINGQSNAVAASRVNKVLASLSRGMFSDNSWESINKIFNKLQELGLDVTITKTQYGGHADTQSGMPKFKEWQVSIPFTNKNGKPTELVGVITAHGAGSVDQPLDRYDITAYVSPKAR